MNVSDEVFSPVIAVLSIAAVFAALVLMFVADLPFSGPLRAAVHRHAQKAIFLVAAVATGSSLFYSEFVGYTPCDLCWFQRIAMYPIAILLLVALVSRDRFAPRYIVTLAGIGLAISTYHYQLELFPDQAQICSAVVSCTHRFVEEFGFVSIPFMAGSGFVTILLLQICEWRAGQWLRREEG